jgi:hypothetical protein
MHRLPRAVEAGEPVRPSYIPRRIWWEEKVGLFFDRLLGRINCARGKHWVKFGTAPYCTRCGRRP